MDAAKIEALIQEMAKKGMQPAMIGQKLKEEHGVLYIKHSMGKSLTQIMDEKGIKPADTLRPYGPDEEGGQHKLAPAVQQARHQQQDHG